MQPYNPLSTPQSSSSTSSPNQTTTPTGYIQIPDNGRVGPGTGFTSAGGSSRGKRRKVAKACLACQKSHLTCDELRPCSRCLKKGTGDQCVEGVRKIAKYLLESEDRGSSSAGGHNPPPTSSSRQQTHTASPPLHLTQLPEEGYIEPINVAQAGAMVTGVTTQGGKDVWLAPPLESGGDGDLGLGGLASMGGVETVFNDWGGNQGVSGNAGYGGGDGGASGLPAAGQGYGDMYPTAAADEFEMFDAMFTSMSPIFPFLDLPMDNNDPNLNDNLQPNMRTNEGINLFDNLNFDNTIPLPAQNQPIQSINPPGLSPLEHFVSQHQQQQQRQRIQPIISPWSIPPEPTPQTSSAPPVNDTHSQKGGYPASTQTIPLAMHGVMPDQNGNGNSGEKNDNGTSAVWERLGQMGPAGTSGARQDAPLEYQDKSVSSGTKGMSASEVYKNVTKPYDYTEGYHVLMDYLSANFERRDILRVVHALATYRPSLIALQMPLSEEDEVFLEKSFQRTLIELEKLISYTSTPTAVWRRTGEIVYANPEFCKLVMASELEVLGVGGKRVYVYQMFKRDSVITYWENFSLHAFENTTQNFFQAVNLRVGGVRGVIGDGGDPLGLRCSCCFTIRRDVFDLPSVVIGQFLPIP